MYYESKIYEIARLTGSVRSETAIKHAVELIEEIKGKKNGK